MQINKFVSLFVMLIFIAGCRSNKKPVHEQVTITPHKIVVTSTTPQEPSPFITIWVHGTQLLPSFIFHNFFHKPEGLIPARDFDPQYHLHQIAKTLSDADPINYPFDQMYLFGWSGKLDFKERKKAAHDLHEAIKKRILDYRKEHNGMAPRIRIITHSHGGNVALNLAKIIQEDDFTIDELILLACPVQAKTAQCIKKGIFKEIFALYSTADLIQIIDPQGIYKHKKPRPLFSQRCFPEHSNITQVQIKLNGHALHHIDFIRLNFVRLLPRTIAKMRTFHMNNKPSGESETPRLLSISTTV